MSDRPMYMISVAAELVGMHPQTLRIYETKGLVRPRRTPGGTRLYSEADISRLRIIQQLTTELGLNLAGVERVLTLAHERYLPGDTLKGATLFHLWLAGALWIVAWTGAAYDVLRRRRR